MISIPANYSSSEIEHKCPVCEEKENMLHVYKCKKLNEEEPDIKYEYIFTNNLKMMKSVYKRFEKNVEIREQIMKENDDKKEDENDEKKKENYEKKKETPHVIHTSDPLYFVYSNG